MLDTLPAAVTLCVWLVLGTLTTFDVLLAEAVPIPWVCAPVATETVLVVSAAPVVLEPTETVTDGLPILVECVWLVLGTVVPVVEVAVADPFENVWLWVAVVFPVFVAVPENDDDAEAVIVKTPVEAFLVPDNVTDVLTEPEGV